MGHDVARARHFMMGASLLGILSFAAPAAADEKQACVAASEKAQQLRSAGKLGEAREQLGICGRAECPKLIQQDCTQWMSEVLAALPSVVPAAKDGKGRDLVDVRLTVDGKVATERLDGKPIVLDPGVHSFVFEAKGAAAVKEQVVVKPGEKNRIVTVAISVSDEGTASGGPPSSGAGAVAPADTGSRAQSSSPPVLAYVLGGLGLVALGAALVLDLGASSDARGLRETCAPNCNQSDVDDVQSKYTIAGVTAGIGGALLITGVVLLIVHLNHGAPSASARALHPSARSLPIAAPRGGSVALFRF
jgi:hypothetical protein